MSIWWMWMVGLASSLYNIGVHHQINQMNSHNGLANYYVGAAYCYRPISVVCRCTCVGVTAVIEPCKNCLTD